mgnify:FL=1
MYTLKLSYHPSKCELIKIRMVMHVELALVLLYIIFFFLLDILKAAFT